MATRSETRIKQLKVDVYTPEDGAASRKSPVIVLAHGLWVGGWIWEGFASYLADHGYVCYVPTWRGHYDSRAVKDLGKVKVEDFAEDLRTVVDGIGADVVIGESSGGLFAMKAAENLPQLKALVLMNSAPPFMVPASPKVVLRQLKYLPDLLFGRSNKPKEADYKALILNNVEEPEASDFYRKICADSGTAIRQMSLGRVKVDTKKIACPVYVVIGHLDAILPLKVHRRVAEMFGAEVAEYPEMSHHTFSEEGWEKVADELLSWLADRVLSADSAQRPRSDG